MLDFEKLFIRVCLQISHLLEVIILWVVTSLVGLFNGDGDFFALDPFTIESLFHIFASAVVAIYTIIKIIFLFVKKKRRSDFD